MKVIATTESSSIRYPNRVSLTQSIQTYTIIYYITVIFSNVLSITITSSGCHVEIV